MDFVRASVPCNGCTACCRGDVILLMPEEGDDVASYETQEIPGVGAILKKGTDGNCIYLGPKGCTIHDRAPVMCRVFDCRMFYASKTRKERRALVASGHFDKDVLDAGRARLDTLR